MKRPTLEVADIIRSAGNGFIERNRTHLGWQQLKVLRAVKHCRTAALGGHLDQCSRCGYRAISFYSCRNRHCPKCQTNARNKWLAARSDELLGVTYSHVVFTLPHELAALALQNKKAIYDLLFGTSAGFRKKYSAACFEANSSTVSSTCSATTSSSFMAISSILPNPGSSAAFFASCTATIGWSTSSHHSAGRNMFSNTWHATHIASPSPITDSYPSLTGKSLSA